MKKPALIDLDVIDALILENIKGHESLANGTPSKMLVSGKLTAFAVVSQGLSSQPALVALLLKAWEGGSEAKRCEFWMETPTSFTDFLTHNNLTDETA